MTDAVLELDRVCKRYGEVSAVRELNLAARVGELFGVVGGAGAGKTTTLRIALGILAADSGQVRWRSQPITAATRSRLGYLPAELGLYPKMRLLEQLVYVGELHGLSVNEAHRNAEIWIDRLDLRAHRTHQVGTLCEGNRRRAQLAAALVHDPEVLVLDEPFTNLDNTSVELVSTVLREKAIGGTAVFLSSCQLDLAERLCDRVGVIHNGQMLACGTIQQLLANGSSTVIVDAPDALAGWADALPGTRVRSIRGSRVKLELDEDTGDQDILMMALATGPVREFSRQPPSLVDLFGDAVSANAAHESRGSQSW